MRELRGFWKIIGQLLVGALVVLVVCAALMGAWHPVIQGSIFLNFSLMLVFLYTPMSKARVRAGSPSFVEKFLFGMKDSPAVLDVLMMIASIVACGYVLLKLEEKTPEGGGYQT